jgi:hypothetical protein
VPDFQGIMIPVPSVGPTPAATQNPAVSYAGQQVGQVGQSGSRLVSPVDYAGVLVALVPICPTDAPAPG